MTPRPGRDTPAPGPTRGPAAGHRRPRVRPGARRSRIRPSARPRTMPPIATRYDPPDTPLDVLHADAALLHRLDRDTSGVMVFALSAPAQRHLNLQFERRHAEKTYVARVWGHPAEDSGTVDLPLVVDWPNRPRQHADFATGKPAVTGWRVLSRDADGTARLRLRPRTGRSHQ